MKNERLVQELIIALRSQINDEYKGVWKPEKALKVEDYRKAVLERMQPEIEIMPSVQGETITVQPTPSVELEGGRLSDPKEITHYPNALPDTPSCPTCGNVGVRQGATCKCLHCGVLLWA